MVAINPYLLMAFCLTLYMLVWFGISLWQKRNDVADMAWGLGFVVLAWRSFVWAGYSGVSLVTNILVTIWGVRLASHIFTRLRSKPEDPRYLKWRKDWGKTIVWRSLLQVFLLQGLFLYLISLPLISINFEKPVDLNWLTLLGMLIWLFGFLFEAVADKQLKTHVSNPKNKGKLLTTGLWRYSRHPNYFGEVTLWWGIYVIAMSVGVVWWVIIGPLTITFLILFVSGVPLLEKKYQGRADFEKYKQQTSIFLPLPPKK